MAIAAKQRKGWTQARTAEHYGISRHTVRRIWDEYPVQAKASRDDDTKEGSA